MVKSVNSIASQWAEIEQELSIHCDKNAIYILRRHFYAGVFATVKVIMEGDSNIANQIRDEVESFFKEAKNESNIG